MWQEEVWQPWQWAWGLLSPAAPAEHKAWSSCSCSPGRRLAGLARL